MQPASNAWEACNRRQARENVQPAPSGKTCNQRQAGKHATGANRRKTCDGLKRGKTPSRGTLVVLLVGLKFGMVTLIGQGAINFEQLNSFFFSFKVHLTPNPKVFFFA